MNRDPDYCDYKRSIKHRYHNCKKMLKSKVRWRYHCRVDRLPNSHSKLWQFTLFESKTAAPSGGTLWGVDTDILFQP